MKLSPNSLVRWTLAALMLFAASSILVAHGRAPSSMATRSRSGIAGGRGRSFRLRRLLRVEYLAARSRPSSVGRTWSWSRARCLGGGRGFFRLLW